MDDEIDLLEYWRVIVKRKWLIIALTLVSALAALFYSLNLPKLYRATATIMPVDSSGGGLSAALSAVALLGGGGGGGEIDKLKPILTSKTLANQVVQNLDIARYFPKLAGDTRLSEIEKMDQVTSRLRAAVSFVPEEGIYGVSIVWTDPIQAAELANLYVKELGRFLNSRSLNINFQMIDPAVPAGARFSPKIRVNLMLGAIMGLFVGVFIALIFEFVPNVVAGIQKIK